MLFLIPPSYPESVVKMAISLPTAMGKYRKGRDREEQVGVEWVQIQNTLRPVLARDSRAGGWGIAFARSPVVRSPFHHAFLKDCNSVLGAPLCFQLFTSFSQ